MEGKLIPWMVFLGLGCCVRTGVAMTSHWRPADRALFLRDDLPDMCLETEGKHFSYDSDDEHSGPDHWSQISPCCAGTRQSPIDVPLSTVTRFCFGPLKFTDPGRVEASVMNNGHTLKCSDFSRPMTMSNVPHSPGDTYGLLQVHLHWGSKDALASEHKLNGAGFIGEMHLVFYNMKYGSSKDAMKNPDGLAVVGVFLKEGLITANVDLQNLLKKSASCTNPNASTRVQLNPRGLLPLTQAYVTYPGSLTTPPCSQNVRWILMLQPVLVSSSEMNELRRLMEDGMHTIASHSNERPVQSVNGRPIQLNACPLPVVG